MAIGTYMSKDIPQQVVILVDKHLSVDLVAINVTWIQNGEEQHLRSVLTGQSFLEVGPQSIAVIVSRVLQEYAKGVPSSEENQKLI